MKRHSRVPATLPRWSLRKSKTLLVDCPPPGIQTPDSARSTASLYAAPRHVVQISFPPVCLTSLRPRKDAEVYRELKTNQAQRQFYPALRSVQFPVSYKWEETSKIIRVTKRYE